MEQKKIEVSGQSSKKIILDPLCEGLMKRIVEVSLAELKQELMVRREEMVKKFGKEVVEQYRV
jgi:hypothetical protein